MAARKKDSAQGALLDQDSTQPGVAPSPSKEGLRGSHSPDGSGHLHVARVALRHFGGVGAQERVLDFGPGANVIAGANMAGKTTVLEALRCALRMTRSAASRNAHIGSGEKPEITVTLRGGDREIVVRCLGDESPTVREIIGEDVRDVPRAVEFLKDLVDVGGADPAVFERAKPDEQAEMLLEALDFPNYNRAAALEAAGLQDFRLPAIPAGLHPLEDLEKVFAAVEEARRATGSERDTEKATAARLLKDLPAEAPAAFPGAVRDAEAARSYLEVEIARADESAAAAHREAEASIKAAFDAERMRLSREVETEAARLRAAAEARIVELCAERDVAIDAARTAGERELSAADERRDAALAALESKKVLLAEQREKLAGLRAQATNVETDRRLRQTAQEAKAKADSHEARWKELDSAIRALKRHAAELASQAPIKGLVVTLDEKGKRMVTLDGKPLEKLSGAESKALGARVAALRSRSGGTERPLRLILLDELGNTTLSPRRALLDELAAGGAQVIAALAVEDAELAVRGPEAA